MKKVTNLTIRCEWTGDDPLMTAYHDEEWGVPKHDDRRLFEDLILDGAQAGLSWRTILGRRDNYRLAFDNFDPIKVAAYDESKIEELLQNAGFLPLSASWLPRLGKIKSSGDGGGCTRV